MLKFLNIKKGDKIKFGGVRTFWFLDMIEDGKKLKRGEVYTVLKIDVASSWTGVILEETGKKYNLAWFEEV